MPRRSTGSEAISCRARSICEIVEPGTKIIPLAGFVDPCYDVKIRRVFGKNSRSMQGDRNDRAT